MIRPLNREELPQRLAWFGPLFFKESGMPGTLNLATYTAMWERLYDQGNGVILELAAGEPTAWLGGVVVDDYLTGGKVGMELFWYALPDHRGLGALKLLPCFERWCKDHGAARLWMIHLVNAKADKMARYYSHAGYDLVEHMYLKELI